MKLTYTLTKPIKFVFDHLSDMNKFCSVHPIISKIESIGNNNFKVSETLTVGFIPISFTYPITINHDWENKKITMNAVVMKITYVELIFTIKEEEGHTKVDETITIKTLFLLKPFIKSIFKKQHEQLFKNIENLKK